MNTRQKAHLAIACMLIALGVGMGLNTESIEKLLVAILILFVGLALVIIALEEF